MSTSPLPRKVEGLLFMEYKEIFMDVVGYEGLYQVSNLGMVKSLERTVNGRWGKQIVKSRILKHTNNKGGYPIVCLCNGKKVICITIHRIMCLSFIPNPENKRTVNHINGVKTDNRISNLEWATDSENQKHSFENGFQYRPKKIPRVLKVNDVREIKYENKDLTHDQIAEKYGVTRGCIYLIRSGKRWPHI
jgi:hypothetical protein